MIHSFDTEIAKDVGIIPAVLFNNILHWIKKNEATEKNFYDGEYWTYNSNKAFQTLFDYLTADQIRRGLEKLKDAGYIATGNYNENRFDKTTWFSLAERGKLVCHIDVAKMPNVELANKPTRCGKNAKCIIGSNSKLTDDKNTDTKLSLSKDERAIDSTIDSLKSRINAMYHRRESTAWSVKETTQLKIISKRPEVLEELGDIEKWHETPNGKQFGRHDVITFLNNFSTEVDRARAFLANPNPTGTQRLGTDGKPLNAYNDPRDPLAFARGHFSMDYPPPTTEMNF